MAYGAFVWFLVYFRTDYIYTKLNRDGYGRDRMVVGFTTTFAISAYHH
jgi:hypothetical protein